MCKLTGSRATSADAKTTKTSSGKSTWHVTASLYGTTVVKLTFNWWR